MLLNHHRVHYLWISECKEAEAAGAARRAIAHDCAFEDFSKLREVGAEGLVCRLPIETTDEHLPIRLVSDHSSTGEKQTGAEDEISWKNIRKVVRSFKLQHDDAVVVCVGTLGVLLVRSR